MILTLKILMDVSHILINMTDSAPLQFYQNSFKTFQVIVFTSMHCSFYKSKMLHIVLFSIFMYKKVLMLDCMDIIFKSKILRMEFLFFISVNNI